MFVEEMPARISAFRDAFESDDIETVHRAAHQLKGSAGSYGFDALTPLAAALEFAVAEKEPAERVRETLDQLVAACERVTDAPP